MIKEKALLVFLEFKKFNFRDSSLKTNKPLDENIEELKNLTLSAGASVEEVLILKQDRPNPRFFINSGKVEKIKTIISDKNINLLIFDDEITPSQQRNLQNELNIKIIDRTALILDIFAQRAHSSEGKLQVELAQLNYLFPRLIGKGLELSRLGGGIGTRGPGETKLEVDRRVIRKRIDQLEKKIKKIGIQRNTRKKQRERDDSYRISLIGYTNSGKSTLLNTLTRSNVYVENMLFSTLDSTTRKLELKGKKNVLISDTVGFIEKLPHQLIASFKSTLDEVRDSNLLLLVIDASSENFKHNINSVNKVLREIEVKNKNIVFVFNKIDKINTDKLNYLTTSYEDAVFISALKGTGLDALFNKINKIIDIGFKKITVRIPYNDQRIISFIYTNSNIIKKTLLEDAVILKINIDSKYCPIISRYIYKERGAK